MKTHGEPDLVIRTSNGSVTVQQEQGSHKELP